MNNNDQYNIFHNHLLRAINEIAPLKTLSNKENKSKIKPWITKGIRKSINRKNKIYKKYVKNKNENTYEEYKKIRNKLNHIIRESKRIHYSKYFEDNKQNAKRMWSGINDILNKKRKKGNNNIHLQVKNKIITNPKVNEYFTTIAAQMVNKQKQGNIDANTFKKNRIKNSFFITPTTEDEVTAIR